MGRALGYAWVVALSFAAGASAADDDRLVKKVHSTGKSGAPEPSPFTPERETAALEFVAKHHAELGRLLTRLKELNREDYERAVRELFATRERLAAVERTDERQYPWALELWQVESQIKLLAARHAYAAKPDPATEAELKQLLYRQVDLQRQIIEHNRDRALESIKGMNDNIKLLQDKRDEFVERRLQGLIRIPAAAAAQAAPQSAVEPAAEAKP
jgi:hypothetical protein